MIVNQYAMFDRVSQTYGEPFCAQKHELAQRRFNYICSQSPMVANDMQLYCLGQYNTDTGEIAPKLEFICNYSSEVK